jgi:hypothetical protein
MDQQYSPDFKNGDAGGSPSQARQGKSGKSLTKNKEASDDEIVALPYIQDEEEEEEASEEEGDDGEDKSAGTGRKGVGTKVKQAKAAKREKLDQTATGKIRKRKRNDEAQTHHDDMKYRIGYLRGEDDDLILPNEQAEIDEQKGAIPKLSYKKVTKHKSDVHPRDREDDEKYHCWYAQLRYLYLPCSAPGAPKQKESNWITEPAKEIGLGATLFLMTYKAFAWLFILLLIVNIPLMMMFLAGNGPSYVPPGFVGFLGKFTLGNMGTSEYTCNNVNIASFKKTMLLSCPYGQMQTLY